MIICDVVYSDGVHISYIRCVVKWWIRQVVTRPRLSGCKHLSGMYVSSGSLFFNRPPFNTPPPPPLSLSSRSVCCKSREPDKVWQLLLNSPAKSLAAQQVRNHVVMEMNFAEKPLVTGNWNRETFDRLLYNCSPNFVYKTLSTAPELYSHYVCMYVHPCDMNCLSSLQDAELMERLFSAKPMPVPTTIPLFSSSPSSLSLLHEKRIFSVTNCQVSFSQ